MDSLCVVAPLTPPLLPRRLRPPLSDMIMSSSTWDNVVLDAARDNGASPPVRRRKPVTAAPAVIGRRGRSITPREMPVGVGGAAASVGAVLLWDPVNKTGTHNGDVGY